MKIAFSLISSLLLAALLTIMPLPIWLQWLQPQWVALVVIFWSIYLPNVTGAAIAFFTGILLDYLTGSVLGQHAIALILINYLVVLLNRQIRFFTEIARLMIIFLLMLIYQGIIFWIQAWVNEMPGTLWYWVSSVTSVVAWPLISWILLGIATKFRMVSIHKL